MIKASNVSYIRNTNVSFFHFTQNCNANKEIKTTLYYKLPYLNSFSNKTKKKVKELYKNFVKIPIHLLFFILLKLGVCFRVKTVYQMNWNSSLHTSLFVQDVNPFLLVKLYTIYLRKLIHILQLSKIHIFSNNH